MSLRLRILALSTGLTAVVLILFAVPLAIILKQSATDRAVRESEYVTQGVADYLSTGNYTQTQGADFVNRVNQRSGTQVTVQLPGRVNIGASLPDDAPGAPSDEPGEPSEEHRDGDGDDLGAVTQPRTTRLADGWLIDIQASSRTGRALVRGFVGEDDIRQQVLERWAWIGGGAAALLALSAVGAELVSRRLTRPLVATASTASALSSGDLDARAPVGGAREIAQVSTALNKLADRIEYLLASERETVADLSHRLRTPMTAIRLDVEA
ncbi:MAG: HAMP domain-containing protein, partial [Aeromicrobium sp.]